MSEYLTEVVNKAKTAVSTGTDLIVCVAGAGSGAAILEVVRSWLPEQTTGVEDETLLAIIGFVLFFWGEKIHPLLVPFGFGAFLSGIGAWSSSYVSGLILMLKKKV